MDLRAYTDQYVAAFREDAARARARGGRGDAARDRPGEPRGDGGPDRALERARPHLPQRRVDLLPHRDVARTTDKLARLDHDGIKPGARVDGDTYAKDDARDFVLWKATKPGEPTWDVGRSARPPGLAPRVLGDGAAAARRAADRHPRRRHRPDLPASRERDRAERRARPASRSRASGCTSSTCIVDDEKMSKSLGNIYTRPRRRRRRATARRRCATCCSRRTTASSSTSRGRAWSRPKRRCGG